MNRLASELNRSGHTSWQVPNRKRKLPNGFAMPGPRDVQLGTIVAVVDSSGSTTGKTCAYFINTLVKTIQNVDFDELIVLHCDTSVRKVLRYTKRQAQPGKVDTNVYGGGGTRFCPAFQWVKDNVRGKVSALVFMTDGGTMHSDVVHSKEVWEQKRYPLLWALYSDWGTVETFINWVHVNDRWGRVSKLPADKW
jgi:predicted metal-dependent peptidase